MIRQVLGALILGLGMGLAQTGNAAPTETDLAGSAKAAFVAGRIELARMLALAAVNDGNAPPEAVAEALAVLAGVGLATSEPEAARVVAAQSFRRAPTAPGQFTAARLAARAAVETGQSGIAKYWLRRAVQVAPDDRARAATIRDFTLLRSRARLRLDVDMSIKPSDNVNQGARDSLLVIDGQPTWFYFDGSTMALSGVEAATNLGLRYRLAGSADAPTELGLRLYHRAVGLSDAARRQAPGARGADFSNSAVDAMLFHSLRLSSAQTLRGGLTLGKTWLAGQPYSDRARIDAALTTRNSARSTSRIGLAVERQWLASGRAPATALALDGGFQFRLASGDNLALKLELAETWSSDANQDHRRIGTSLRYARARPVLGSRLSGSLSLTARDYPVFFNGIFNDTGREDMTVSGSIDLALPRMGAWGFEPVLSLEASRTRSNVSRYDSAAMGLGLRIQSSF